VIFEKVLFNFVACSMFLECCGARVFVLVLFRSSGVRVDYGASAGPFPRRMSGAFFEAGDWCTLDAPKLSKIYHGECGFPVTGRAICC